MQIGDALTIRAPRIVIATGSSPSHPPAWDALGDRLIVSDDVFEWSELPGSVAVFGPGAIVARDAAKLAELISERQSAANAR